MRKIALLVIVIGVFISINAVIIPAKAWLSVELIEKSWREAIETGEVKRPWSWLDSEPVAKLFMPKHKWENVVLAGVSGEVMAFAPGWHRGTAYLGEEGVSLISAHKDTHFAVLRELDIGDKVILSVIGENIEYKVSDFMISEESSIFIDKNINERILVLSTCYPFSSLQNGGNRRFIVILDEVMTLGVDKL